MPSKVHVRGHRNPPKPSVFLQGGAGAGASGAAGGGEGGVRKHGAAGSYFCSVSAPTDSSRRWLLRRFGVSAPGNTAKLWEYLYK